MRLAVFVALVLLACGSAHADLDGTTVELVGPGVHVDPDSTYTFAFRVSRDMSSTEIVTSVMVLFYPVDLTLYQASMEFDEIVPGRPSFEMEVQSTAATWEETRDLGGIHAGESTVVRVDVHTGVSTPPASKGLIGWGAGGAEGSTNGGYIWFYTPVESTSWGRIKALYQ